MSRFQNNLENDMTTNVHMVPEQNPLTLKADVITLLLQLKHPVQDQSVGIDDGLPADINSNTLIHCLCR